MYMKSNLFTLEVSLGWSDTFLTSAHLSEILSNISLYGTNFLKFHLLPKKKEKNAYHIIVQTTKW